MARSRYTKKQLQGLPTWLGPARQTIAGRGASRVAKQVAETVAGVPEGRPVRVQSYGGGLESWAMLLAGIERGDLPDLIVFADVGDPTDPSVPGEWPSTYRHIAEVAIPLCDMLGIPFVTVDSNDYPVRPTKALPEGSRSLWAWFQRTRSMPSRMNKMCTTMSKVERINDWVEDYLGDLPVEMWIGFSAGEVKRAKRASDPYAQYSAEAGERTKRYPLIEWKLCRCRCEKLARKYHYPVPRKSACVFCPEASKGDFQTLRDELECVFDQLAEQERRAKRTKSGARITWGEIAGKPVTIKQWTAQPYNPRSMTCPVCGQTPRATKATACTYLREGQRLK